MKILNLVGLYESNVYVLEKGNECIIIDAGVSVSEVKKLIKDKKVLGIFLTHGHFDHSFFAGEYAHEFGCKIYAHHNAKLTMENRDAFCSNNGQIITDFSNFEFFNGDTRFVLGDFEIDAFYLPGHCNCECGYLIEGNFFAGDFLFEKSFGRIDLMFSSKKDMIASLIKSQDIPYNILYSGHGEKSTKKEQLSHLPIFLKFLTRN